MPDGAGNCSSDFGDLSPTETTLTMTYDAQRYSPKAESYWSFPSCGLSSTDGYGCPDYKIEATFSTSTGCQSSELTVAFEKTYESVYAYASDGGTVTQSQGDQGSTAYSWGTSVTLTATPYSCFRFVRWEYTGNYEGGRTDPHGIDGSTSPTVNLTALPCYKTSSNCWAIHSPTYKAVFERIPVTVTAVVDPPGSGTVDPSSATLDCGDGYQSFTVTPEECWVVDRWSTGDTGNTIWLYYPEEDTTVTVYLKKLSESDALLCESGLRRHKLLFQTNGDALIWAGCNGGEPVSGTS
jgi:hypothetical protein